MRKKIAVVGDKGSVLGFKAVGFDVYDVVTKEETTDILAQLTNGDYGVVFITEQVYEPVLDYIQTFKEYKIPAIIPIPSKDGTLGIGIANVKKNVERAVGADILFKDE